MIDNIEIPDDFYTITFNQYTYLCHKSCTESNDGSWSNDRFVYTSSIINIINKGHIENLRDICNIYDIITEKTYFKENTYNELVLSVYNKNGISLHSGDKINFACLEDLLDYLAENYPECIRNDEIKIALKD